MADVFWFIKLLLKCFAKPEDYPTDPDTFNLFPWHYVVKFFTQTTISSCIIILKEATKMCSKKYVKTTYTTVVIVLA